MLPSSLVTREDEGQHLGGINILKSAGPDNSRPRVLRELGTLSSGIWMITFNRPGVHGSHWGITRQNCRRAGRDPGSARRLSLPSVPDKTVEKEVGKLHTRWTGK